MIRLSAFALLATALLALGCGGTTPGGDVTEDIQIGVDSVTNDTATDTPTSDRVEPDAITQDNGDQDTTETDAFVEDTSGTDTGDSDTSLEDVATDTTVDPGPNWVRMSVQIEDPVVNGKYLMNPVDGITFGYNATGHEYITQFDRDWNDASITYMWHLDESTGIHSKKMTGGDVFADGTSFCMDESWCQFIGFDATDSTWVVMGPRTPAVMKVDASWQATQYDLVVDDPDQAPNGAISYSHIYDGAGFWVYGYVSGTGFSDSLRFFDVATADWQVIKTDLTPVFTNCLTKATALNQIISVGGVTTDDGGETSYALGKLQIIDLGTNEVTITDLPTELAPRESMSCAFDDATSRLYVFGGAEMKDNYDERNNIYHNDLWMFEGGVWTNLLPDGAVGEFRQYGDSWSLKADASLPNFGRNMGRMMFDANGEPRLVVIGDVPGTATQLYTLKLSDLDL
ncbi:hypothetical protein KBA39_05965 [Myxococcota bacterium]|nr:hypothetical protein [Myxococcota bacterium]